MKIIISIFMGIISLVFSGCSLSSDYNRGTFKPTNKEPVTVDFTRISKLIIIEAKVNGVTGHFLYDNGFSMSAVNADFAERAKIRFTGSSTIRDANSKRAKVKETTVKLVDIKGQQFTDTGFYLINTKAFLPCEQIDGVIGASIINKANWKIDFQNQQIKLSSTPFIEKGFHLKTHINSTNTTHTNIKVNGKKVSAMIDLGSTTSLKLSLKKYQMHFDGSQIERQFGIHSLSTTGFGNIQTSYLTNKQYSLEQGVHRLPLSTSVLLRGKNKYPAYLGVDYFDEYRVIINSHENEYILTPYSDIENSINRDKSYGIAINKVKNNWRIIKKDSNNSQLNSIKVLDIIQKIDDLDMNTFSDICSINEYIIDKKSRNEELQITVDNSIYNLPYKENDLSILEL